jgi:hypothetical protein
LFIPHRYSVRQQLSLESSSIFFESMAVAGKEGKKALARLLAKAKHAA